MEMIDKILKRFGIKKEWKCQKNMVKDSLLKVTIKDDLFAVTLGQWLGVLPDALKVGGKDSCIYTALPAEDFLKDFTFTNEQKEIICKKIAYLFNMAGYNIDDVCLLQNFDNEKLTFDAKFLKGKSLDCQITWGHFLDACPQFRIRDGKEYYKYDFSSNKKEDKLSLEVYENSLDNGNTYHYYDSEYRYHGKIFNDQYRLNVEIKYPEDIKDSDNIYVDKVKMQNILSEISFPADIQKICTLVSSALLVEPNLFPEINVCVKKVLEDKKQDEIIDKAVFKNGEFHEFVITKDGKTIVVDKFDNWSIKDKYHSVTGNSDVEIGYVVNKVPKGQLALYNNPVMIIDSALFDYEDAKGIALTLLKKEK